MTSATNPRKAWVVAAAAALSLMSGACLGGADATTTTVVTTREMHFTPNRLDVSAHTPLAVVVNNKGSIMHTFSVNDLDIEIRVPPGKQGRVLLDAAPGRYRYVCRILDHEGLGMSGTIIVR